MYSVSNDFKAAMLRPVIQSKITGTVNSVSFTDANIIAGSLRITAQNAQQDEISIGTASSRELTITFAHALGLVRTTLQKKAIVLSYHLLVGETWEEVPLGTYYIDEASWTLQGIKCRAFDAMGNFDKQITEGTVYPTSGKAYDFLSWACLRCGVTLGMTQAAIEAMTNGNISVTYLPGNVKTYRDYIAAVAGMLGCFALISRSNELILRKYSRTSCATYTPTDRLTGASFSDFVTQYAGFMIYDDGASAQQIYQDDEVDGLLMDMGANPFMQGNETVRENLITEITNIAFTPHQVSMNIPPIHDLGDCLTFSGGIGDTELHTLNYISWTYHKSMTLTGYGKNPAFAQASTAKAQERANVQGAITSLTNKVENFWRYGVVFLLPTEQYPLPTDTPPGLPIEGGDSAEILRWEFEVTQEKAPAAVHAIIDTHVETLDDDDTYTDCSVNIEVRGDGALIATWDEVYGDGEHLIEIDVIKKYFETGDHVITVKITPNDGNLNPALKVKSAYLETRARVHVAKSWSKSYFWRDLALSNCEVSNINTYVSGSSIGALSEHFLTGEVLWVNSGVDNGGRLWRINKNTRALWTGANFTYTYNNHQYQLRQDEGQTVFMTLLYINGGTSIRFISKGGEGSVKMYHWNTTSEQWEYVSNGTATTYQEVEGIDGEGEWRNGFNGTSATVEVVTKDYLETHECLYKVADLESYGIAVEAEGTLAEFAMQEFLGTDENDPGTAINPYPNRYLLSYYGSGVTKTYIPVSRDEFGWDAISATGKLFQSGTSDPLVGIGAGAVVDGQMVEVVATSAATSWTRITADISELPYIDYIILYGKDGAQGLREISVSKTEIPEDEEEW